MSIIQRGKGSLLKYLDTVFVINGEMIEDNGEDSFAFSVNEKFGMLGAFDGCGGIGSRKYAEYDNKSGAYVASRVASDVTMEWFRQLSASNISTIDNRTALQVTESLKMRLIRKLETLETGTKSSMIRGSLAKSFPTTTSVVLFSNIGEGVRASFIWAGDSRGYMLTPMGLCQITRDDIEEGIDALTNLSNDSKLTNLVYADGEFELHSRVVTCHEPSVLVTATDGCFGYFSTPMEFEFVLVESMMHATNITQWKTNLEQCIKKYTADDYTMGIAVCGYRDFKSMKQAFIPRRMDLVNKYISRLEVGDETAKLQLWEDYKKTYYRGV